MYPIVGSLAVCSAVDVGILLLFEHTVNVRSSLDGRVGLPEDVDPLHRVREPQLDVNPLIQGWRDWDFSNVVFWMNV